MSNWPFDPKPPQFPWYQPPVTPNPVAPSLADLIRPAPTLNTSFLAELLKPKRPRIFVSYQHSSDQYYYNLFSSTFHDSYEAVYDNSLRDEVDSEDTEYIIQRIRDEFITGTSCTIVLVGPTSYQRKYIDWEIKATLDREHGLIGLQLPNVIPDNNGIVLVPPRFNVNINSDYALWQGFTWQQVIANPGMLPQLVQTAVDRSKTLIRNPKDIKKQNG
jgi:hypothetical protein